MPLCQAEAAGPPAVLWTPRETARAMKISERKLWGITRPRGPLPVVKIGRAVRYDPGDVARFIDQLKSRGDGDGGVS
jgi:hypothetical protein